MSESPRVAVGLVAVGGSIGALARWSVGTVAPGPAGTLLVNVAGSFLLAVLTTRETSAEFRSFGAAGFCSSFTTYSALAVESVGLGPFAGVGYLVVTHVAGLLAASVGVRLGGDA